MRSRLGALAPLAWFALVWIGLFAPIGQARAMPEMIDICTADGIRRIASPLPARKQGEKDCAKGCHALCQRKRPDGGAKSESGDLP